MKCEFELARNVSKPLRYSSPVIAPCDADIQIFLNPATLEAHLIKKSTYA
jgi:hypothetical protein